MSKEQVDLSAFPSYLGVPRPEVAPVVAAPVGERVVRGLAASLWAGLTGVVLGAALAALGAGPEPVGLLMGAVTAGGMALLYARVARSVPRQGLVPLFVVVALALVTGVACALMAIVGRRAWQVYSLLEDFHLWASRSQFIRETVTDPQVLPYYHQQAVQLAVCGAIGAVVALAGIAVLWKLRGRTDA